MTDIFEEIDETIEIPAGEHKAYQFSFPDGGALKYEFTVTSGPAIDVLMIREGEFNYFEQGYQVNYNSAHTVQDNMEGSSSADISEGSYYLTFDNSEMGRAQPPTPEPTPTATPEPTDSADETATVESTATDAEGTESMDGGSESTDSSGGSSGATATVELSITAAQ